MGTNIIDRIRIIYKNECGSIKSFSEIINISENTLKNVISRGILPNFEILRAIAFNFPQYSMDWVITGEGNPIKQLVENETKKNNKTKVVKTNSVETNGLEIIQKFTEDLLTMFNKTIKEKDQEIKFLNTELIKAKNETIEILKNNNIANTNY